MEKRSHKPQFASRPESSSASITSAIGMEETAGRLRARRHSFFTQTVIWVTILVCLAFLFGSLTQAWSNSQLMQQLQNEQQTLQQEQQQHDRLMQAASHYSNPATIENEARQQLGYVRRGEQPIAVVGTGPHKSQNTQVSSSTAQPQGYWQDWWKLFSGA